MTATMTATAIASFVLLVRSGWWILLALIPLGLAILAYNAAVHAALAYSETVHVAFDSTGARPAHSLADGPAEAAGHRKDPEPAMVRDLWRQGCRPPLQLSTQGITTKPFDIKTQANHFSSFGDLES